MVDYTAELESKITALTGRQVKLVVGRGRKSIQIEYSDNNDLEEIVEKLCGEKPEL